MLSLLHDHRLVVVVRSHFPPPDRLYDVLVGAGVRLIEVTLGTPDALQTVEQWRRRSPDEVMIGVGTVTNPAELRSAIDAGAEFVVTPNVDQGVLELARSSRTPILCGALTPSEIIRAHSLGADAVKVFPAIAVGGPSYIEQITAPLSDVALVAVGGVGIDDAASYVAAGCRAVGVGGALVPNMLIDRHLCDEIGDRAVRLVGSLARVV